MANGSSRLLPGFLLLVVGSVAGCSVSRGGARVPGSDHLIGVHADGSVTLPRAFIERTNRVAWVADGGTTLQILFPESKFPPNSKVPPFAGMTHVGTDWAVNCHAEVCYSGIVNPDLPKGQELQYKYDQVVGGTRTDGMIIINP